MHEKDSGPGDPGYNSTDLSDQEIKEWLNKVYKQAVVEWELVRLPEKTVEFDLNKDGKLDVESSWSWMTDEMEIIRDACKSDHNFNLFLVDNPSKDGVTGKMGHGQKYGFIFVNQGATGQTVCHEIGHGFGGLGHCDELFSECDKNDDDNVMHPNLGDWRWRLRKKQWNKLNP